MTRRFEGKVAIVTGAAGGIGSAIAEQFAQRGARVGLIDFDAQAGAAQAGQLSERGHQVCYAQADVGDFQSCEAAYAAIEAQLGAADIVVNNAGISPKSGGRPLNVWEMPPQEWNRVVDVNLNGVFNLTRLATPHMVARRWGRVINMSSVAGKAYCDFVAGHYAATKAALIGLTRHWAGELGPHGITVNALAPGRISTPLIQSVAKDVNDAIIDVTAMRRLGTPAEVADSCLFFASEQAGFVTGQVLDVAGGWMMT